MSWWMLISSIIWFFIGIKVGENKKAYQHEWTCMSEGCGFAVRADELGWVDAVKENHLEIFHPQGY